jgi:group I intron endonuclease
MVYVVYQALNVVNGKRYIGVTGQGLHARKIQHKSKSGTPITAFHHAICKYGWDAFEWSTLCTCEDAALANRLEIQYIQDLKTRTNDRTGYNQTEGGNGTVGYVFTTEDRAKMAKSSTGRPKSAETRKKLSKAFRGRRISESTKTKLRGQKRSSEVCAKIGAASLGRECTPETRSKIAEGNRRSWASGRKAPKIQSSDIPDILVYRTAGLSFASIARLYDCTAPAVFYAVNRS